MDAQAGEGVGLVGQVSRSAWGTGEYAGMRKLEAALEGRWRLGLPSSCRLVRS